jgi:hypothetical protein
MDCEACKKPLKKNHYVEKVFRSAMKPELVYCSQRCIKFALDTSIEEKWEKIKSK